MIFQGCNYKNSAVVKHDDFKLLNSRIEIVEEGLLVRTRVFD